MINIEQANIYLATTPVDFRKSIDGLSMIVNEEYGCNPGSGDVYVFYNKNKDKLKMIYYDGTGFMLCYKRLEEGKLIISLNSETTQYHMDETQFHWLLSGLDFMRLKKLPKEYQNYA